MVDTGVPIVTLNGSGYITLDQDSPYTELGATWTDTVDGFGMLSVASSGGVDTHRPGTYTLTYTYTDRSGNIGSISRSVEVIDTEAPVVTLSGSDTIMLMV